jgi:hypothetical protein
MVNSTLTLASHQPAWPIYLSLHNKPIAYSISTTTITYASNITLEGVEENYHHSSCSPHSRLTFLRGVKTWWSPFYSITSFSTLIILYFKGLKQRGQYSINHQQKCFTIMHVNIVSRLGVSIVDIASDRVLAIHL